MHRRTLASCLGFLVLVIGGLPALHAADPTITQQPQSLRQVVVGGTTTFTVVASPSAPNKNLSYQWRRRALGSDTNNPNVWTNIPGAQSSTLTLSNVPLALDRYFHSVVVSEPGGSIASDPGAGLLLVHPRIEILSLPPNQSFVGCPALDPNVTFGFLGQENSFLVNPIFNSPTSAEIQWRKNGAIIVPWTPAGFLGSNTYEDFRQFSISGVQEDIYVLEIRNRTFSGELMDFIQSDPITVESSFGDARFFWGNNSSGQLNFPTNLVRVAQLAAGQSHTLAWTDDGRVFAWGGSSLGQTNVPADLTNAVSIAAGWNHSLAIQQNGRIRAWGDTNFHKLDAPWNTKRATAVAAGRNHSMALYQDGKVLCWGANDFGQSTPPLNLSNVIAIAAGADHSLALRSDGKVIAWGRNDQSQCNVPASLQNVVSIAAGLNHSMALRADGTIEAWGANNQGQCTIPSDVVAGLPIEIACGSEWSMAILSNRTVRAWGASSFGQTNAPSGCVLPAQSIACGTTHAAMLPRHELNPPNYPVNPRREVLVIYNTNPAFSNSVAMKDRFMASRTSLDGANVLGLFLEPFHGTTAFVQGDTQRFDGEAATLEEYNHLKTNLLAWLSTNAARRIQYVILMAGVPVRLVNSDGIDYLDFNWCGTSDPTGDPCPSFRPADGLGKSVSGRLGSVFHGNEACISSISLGSDAANAAYIDRLSIAADYSAPASPYIQVDVAAYGGKFYFEDTRGVFQVPEGDIGTMSRMAVTNAGFPADRTLYKGWAAPENPLYFTNCDSVIGFQTWGANGGVGRNAIAVDGSVVFTGPAWYPIFTIESFNGRIGGQGHYVQWFSSNAFGKPNFQGAPIGAVAAVNEPFFPGPLERPDTYFQLWATGRSFGKSAWTALGGKGFIFLALGDPLVSANAITPWRISPKLSTQDRDINDGMAIHYENALRSLPEVALGTNGWNLEMSTNLTSWQTVATTLPKRDGTFVHSNDLSQLTNAFFRLSRGTNHSENQIGFIRGTLTNGFNRLVNRLRHGRSRVDDFLPVVPSETRLYRWNAASQQYSTNFYTFISGVGWTGPIEEPLLPGETVLVWSPAPSFGVTFIGEVSSATLGTPIPAGSFDPPTPTWGETSYVIGQQLATARNGFHGYLGMRFVVGSNAFAVTALGRFKALGNTNVHLVKLVQGSNGLDVPGGSVNVNMNTGTVGEFAYGALTNPVVLAAGATYYLVSLESFDGDSWYDQNTTVTTTAAATEISAVSSNSAASWTFIGGPGQTFGPMNFKYASLVPPPPGSVQFKSAMYSVSETGGTVRVFVSRTGGSGGAASVSYATSDGTALAGMDYVATFGILNWEDQDAADKFFDVLITDDSEFEGTETFTAVLSNPVRVTLGSPGSATISISSNDVPASVIGRWVFYNNSAWDGNDPAPNANDDGAIAPDKVALRHGSIATFTNYTSYSRGINGVMVDIDALVGTPTVNDFAFKVGNDNTPANWSNAPTPASVTVRSGAGAGGSSRVTIIWSNNVIQKQWLQITTKATANTGLAVADVFYFGNAVAESGNSPANAQVDLLDEIGARNHPRNFVNPAPIDFPWDYDRNQRVDLADEIIARNNPASFVTALRLIDLSALGGASAPAGAASQMPGSATPRALPKTVGITKSIETQSSKGGGTATERLTVRRSGPEEITLELNAEVDSSYRLESTGDLRNGSWEPVESDPAIPEKGIRQWKIRISNRGSSRFYRVVTAPP